LPPPLPDELVEEILLRLPPDKPKWLLRTFFVCKTWVSAVSHHSFRRHRLHELPLDALEEDSIHVLGFAEGANVIFVTTAAGLFTIELQS
jgi:hypothetical protein